MPIEVSPSWKRAIQGQFRLPAYMRVSVYVVPPGLREGAQVTTTSYESITSPQQIVDGTADTEKSVATLEEGYWPGDGSAYLASEVPNENPSIGWWSQDIDPGTQTFTFTFDKTYSIPGLWIVWDPVGVSWPTGLSIAGYSAGILTAQYSFDDVGAAEKFLTAPMSNVDSVLMTFTGWSKPGVRARISEVTFGLAMEFNNDSVNSAQLNASAELLSGELPQLGMTFTLNNYDRVFDPTLQTGYASYLAQRQLINVQWGFETSHKNVEWLEPWPLYLNSWSIPADSQTVEMTTTSRLTFLDRDYTRGTFTDTPRTLLSLAEEVLRNSNILKRTSDEKPWEFDPILSTLYSRAPLPADAANVLLQLIANAAGCILDNDPTNNYVRIRQSCVPADYTIGTAQQLGDPSFEITDRLKSITVGLRTFTQQSERKKVCMFKGTLAGQQVLNLVYDSNHIVVGARVASYTGVSSVGSKRYARHLEVQVVAPIEGAYVELTVEGYIVDESTTWIKTYEDESVLSGLEITIDNPLITEMETLNAVAKTVKDMYTRRVSATVPYLGYPELQTGDSVPFTTNYGAFKGDITGLTLEFNGGFNGIMKTKMLNAGVLDRAGRSAWYSAELLSGEV